MPSPAEVVRACLAQKNLVLIPPLPLPAMQNPLDGTLFCYVGSFPDDIDQMLLITDMAGMSFGARQTDRKYLIHPGVHFLVRALTYSRGYHLANKIAEGIQTIADLTVEVDGFLILVKTLYRTSGIISLGEEVGKKRQLFSLHGRIAFQDAQKPLG